MQDRLKKLVKDSGLTGEKFGERIGVSQSLMSMMCSGKTKPTDRTILSICREFGVDETWLRTGSGAPYREPTAEEAILKFAAAAANGSDNFKKNLLYMLSQMDEHDLKTLCEIFDRCKQNLQK